MTSSAYKQYNRGTRNQSVEENFSKGMYFTNAPLSEGAVKSLINFDITNSGASLSPRRGLQVTQVGFPSTIIQATEERLTPHFIVDGKYHVNASDEKAFHVITGQVSDTQIPFANNYKEHTKLYSGVLHFDKIDLENPLNTETTVDILNATSRTKKYLKKLLKDNKVYSTKRAAEGRTIYDRRYAPFIKPKGVQIHGVPVEDSNLIAKQVGTFAYNGDYYTFDVTKDKLFKTDFNTNLADPTQTIEPREITPKEAVSWGYNMLLKNPYTFANENTPGAITLLGCLPYDDADKLQLTPQVNQTLNLKGFFAGPYGESYKVLWEWKELASSTWNNIVPEQQVILNENPLEVKFSSPAAQVLVRLTCTRVGETSPEQVLSIGFDMSREREQDAKQIGTVRYSLERAWGMSYWKQRLIVYGVPEDPTILFFSEVNDPTYFPYPNNVEVFDEPIQYVTPFLDQLLVFTATKLYIMTLSTDGLSWTTQLLQTNLTNNLWDAHLIKVVKNMVFFRSGEYFYMLVPKSSSATGLTIAPISANITNLFDNFKKFVVDSVEMLYNYHDELTLIHYYNYLDYNDMHIVYVFRDVQDRLLNLHLIYNTNDRSWRTHIYESSSFMFPIKADATNRGLLISQLAFDVTEYSLKRRKLGYQILKYNPSEVCDKHFTMQGQYKQYDDFFYRNFQHCNTGHREHASSYKKRFREIQFMLNNTSYNPLTYYTSFYLDGDERRFARTYKTVLVKEPSEYGAGEIILERVLNENAKTQITPSTHLSVSHTPQDNAWVPWRMCVSRFPKNNLWKARIPISGKGYAGQLSLLTQDELDYELLNMIWVYRLMNSR